MKILRKCFLQEAGFVVLRTSVLPTIRSYLGEGQVQMKRMQRISALKSKTKQPKTDCYPHIAFLILMKLGSTRSDAFETL